MPRYRVKPGMRHGAGGKFGPGEIVELTEYEAAGFLDKLELVEEAPDAAEMKWPEDLAVFELYDTPTWQALQAAGINRVGDVMAMSDDELLAVPGIGAGRLRSIKYALKEATDG